MELPLYIEDARLEAAYLECLSAVPSGSLLFGKRVLAPSSCVTIALELVETGGLPLRLGQQAAWQARLCTRDFLGAAGACGVSQPAGPPDLDATRVINTSETSNRDPSAGNVRGSHRGNRPPRGEAASCGRRSDVPFPLKCVAEPVV